MFPAEIYERILLYADGQTLIRAKSVCKQWKRIVEYLEKKYDIWERCCQNELPKRILFAMQDKCGYVEDTKHKWQVIFHNYQSWLNVRNKEYHVLPKQSIDYFENNITCAKISGSRIVYGTTAGIICVLNEQYEVEDVIITDIRGNLKDIIFMNEIQFKITTSYNHTHAIAVYEKCFLILKLEPKIIQVHTVGNVAHLCVYNDIVTYASSDGVVRVARMNFTCGSQLLDQMNVCHVQRPIVIRSLCVYENLVVVVSDNEVLSFEVSASAVSVARPAHSLPFAQGLIERYWTFYNDIVFGTSGCYLYLSTICPRGKGRAGIVTRKYNCMLVLQSPVCDILLYGNILILGMLCGRVYIYLVDDWSEFDLENYDQRINVYGESICGIDVQELPDERRIILSMKNYITQLFMYDRLE